MTAQLMSQNLPIVSCSFGIFCVLRHSNHFVLAGANNRNVIILPIPRGPCSSILGDPGAVSRAGRKGATKVFIISTGGKAPGYRLSPDHFQKVKRMLAPDWAQKMLCIILPNRRTVSSEFFSWVRTRRLLYRHSCLVRSPSFPNQKRRKYW